MRCPYSVGDKVICVAPGDWNNAERRMREARIENYQHPIRGKTYTVRAIFIDPNSEPPNNIGVLLDEIHNPYVRLPSGMIHEIGFWDHDFDIMPDGKIDLSQFVKQEI